MQQQASTHRDPQGAVPSRGTLQGSCALVRCLPAAARGIPPVRHAGRGASPGWAVVRGRPRVAEVATTGVPEACVGVG